MTDSVPIPAVSANPRPLVTQSQPTVPAVEPQPVEPVFSPVTSSILPAVAPQSGVMLPPQLISPFPAPTSPSETVSVQPTETLPPTVLPTTTPVPAVITPVQPTVPASAVSNPPAAPVTTSAPLPEMDLV